MICLSSVQAAVSTGPPPLTQKQKDAGALSVFKPADEHSLRREKPKDPKEKQVDFISDTYAECYPDYQEFGNELVDSDEEDLTKMDTGKNHAPLGRQDFDNEEEWAAVSHLLLQDDDRQSMSVMERYTISCLFERHLCSTMLSVRLFRRRLFSLA